MALKHISKSYSRLVPSWVAHESQATYIHICFNRDRVQACRTGDYCKQITIMSAPNRLLNVRTCSGYPPCTVGRPVLGATLGAHHTPSTVGGGGKSHPLRWGEASTWGSTRGTLHPITPPPLWVIFWCTDIIITHLLLVSILDVYLCTVEPPIKDTPNKGHSE